MANRLTRKRKWENWLGGVHISGILIYEVFAVCKEVNNIYTYIYTGELGYDGPLYNGFLHMTDYMVGPSLMHI